MPFLIRKIKNYIKAATISLLEVHTFKDKLTIARYYLKAPLFLINHLKGKHNSRILSKNVMIKNKYGIFFCGNNLSSVSGFSSISEAEVRKLIILHKGIFVDVGANGGMYAVPLGKMLKDSGKVIAIEPEPNNFQILKKNIKLNNLKNVIPVNRACSNSKGLIDLYLDEIGTGGHSICKKSGNKIRVKTETLDNISKRLKIKKVDLIKIDVEGAEAEVLKGSKELLKKSHPKIIFEAWDESYLKKIKNILKPLNYKIEKIASENYLAY